MGIIKTGIQVAAGYYLIKAASKAANEYQDRKQNHASQRPHDSVPPQQPPAYLQPGDGYGMQGNPSQMQNHNSYAPQQPYPGQMQNNNRAIQPNGPAAQQQQQLAIGHGNTRGEVLDDKSYEAQMNYSSNEKKSAPPPPYI